MFQATGQTVAAQKVLQSIAKRKRTIVKQVRHFALKSSICKSGFLVLPALFAQRVVHSFGHREHARESAYVKNISGVKQTKDIGISLQCWVVFLRYVWHNMFELAIQVGIKAASPFYAMSKSAVVILYCGIKVPSCA